ncbi:hypothetical protein [Chitinophaga eiseniae]|uniref:hypothetical protein n=1 Tax=Chitinophaga eiseniae TaxID=634771 RepID=UPI0009996AF3|nr:hypothetical protein [Chitinophaga eiseniae]
MQAYGACCSQRQPPDSTGQHPVLMTRTPYSCATYGKEISPGNGVIFSLPVRIMYKDIIILFFDDGFIPGVVPPGNGVLSSF